VHSQPYSSTHNNSTIMQSPKTAKCLLLVVKKDRVHSVSPSPSPLLRVKLKVINPRGSRCNGSIPDVASSDMTANGNSFLLSYPSTISPPFAVLHSTNSCQVTVHALLWYRLSLTLLLISSVIRPDHPALWIALSTASILSHP